MKLEELEVVQIRQGYQEVAGGFECLFCGKMFERGEVFPIGGRFFEAGRAVEFHVEEHGVLDTLVASKYNSLTDNQVQLLRKFSSGLSDKEIASELGLSPSTVRHQKFTFREKAKQAKLYLAIYEEAMSGKKTGDALIQIHEGATQVDERFQITEKERESVLAINLESREPLRLKHYPKKEKKKIVLLTEIVKQFERGRKYSEREVSEVLKGNYHDFVSLRRALIEYGFMDRTDNGDEYWVK